VLPKCFAAAVEQDQLPEDAPAVAVADLDALADASIVIAVVSEKNNISPV